MSEKIKGLSDKIRKLRKEKRITQRNLGKAIGVTSPHICDIEHGRKAPSLYLLEKLEKELGPIW